MLQPFRAGSTGWTAAEPFQSLFCVDGMGLAAFLRNRTQVDPGARATSAKEINKWYMYYMHSNAPYVSNYNT